MKTLFVAALVAAVMGSGVSLGTGAAQKIADHAAQVERAISDAQ